MFKVGLVVIIGTCVMNLANGHGRMMNPPGRASMWRKGFNTPPDYNDNAAFCGGFQHQWEEMDGKCGICGDAYDADPRPHEAPGGQYATGTIAAKYQPGSWVDVEIEVTAQHKGVWIFKICPNNDVNQDPKQDCFDNGYGELEVSTGGTQYEITTWSEGNFNLQVKLPEDLVCDQCIFQWRWNTGNSWGTCENGTEAIGCGNQETFMSCSDISIHL